MLTLTALIYIYIYIYIRGFLWLILHNNDYKIGLIFKKVSIQLKSILIKLTIICKVFFFLLLVSEIEELWSILIIKQYFAECVFVPAPWLV